MGKSGITFRQWAPAAFALLTAIPASAATITGTPAPCAPGCESPVPDGLAPVRLTLPYFAPAYAATGSGMAVVLPLEPQDLPLLLLMPLPAPANPGEPLIPRLAPDPPAGR